MNNDLYFDGKKYISSSRAAKISGYVNDYIGQLCRDGKLECRMVGRSWYVSLESLVAHKNANGNVSKNKSQKLFKTILIEDAIPTDASPSATSKTNENTTAHVVAEPFIPTEPIYNQRAISIPDFSLEEKGEREGVALQSKDNDFQEHVIPVVVKKDQYAHEVPSPLNVVQVSVPKATSDYPHTHHLFFEKTFPKIASFALAIIISFFGFRFMLSQNETAQVAYKNIQTVAYNTFVGAIQGERTSLSANIFSSARGGLDKASLAVYHTMNKWLYDARVKVLVMTGRNVPSSATNVSEQETRPSQGMVVVPVDSKTNKDAVVAKIKNSFSDEVSVEPGTDGESGVITPVFKKVKGDDYLYVLVPIKN